MTESLEATERALRAMLLDPSEALLHGVPPARQRAMRRLVQNNLRGVIARATPHARRLAGADAFSAWVTRFLSEAPPATRLVREIPLEFARFVSAFDAGARGPHALPHASFAELVHWETVELEVMFAPDPAARTAQLVDTIVAHPSARLCAYRHDVVAVDEHTLEWPAPRDEPIFVLCFRVEDRVRWRRLSAGCARVLAAVAEGAALSAALGTVLSTARSSAREAGQSPLDAELSALQAAGALSIVH